MSGKTLGIFGFGNIGKRAAEIGAALGMRILVHTRTKREMPYEYVEREELFARADFLSLHCPQGPDTLHIVNGETLSLMKPTAILINTARGGLIDENALADALNGGRLAGAYLDVLSEEPVRPENPLLRAKNCHITPHVALAAPRNAPSTPPPRGRTSRRLSGRPTLRHRNRLNRFFRPYSATKNIRAAFSLLGPYIFTPQILLSISSLFAAYSSSSNNPCRFNSDKASNALYTSSEGRASAFKSPPSAIAVSEPEAKFSRR